MGRTRLEHERHSSLLAEVSVRDQGLAMSTSHSGCPSMFNDPVSDWPVVPPGWRLTGEGLIDEMISKNETDEWLAARDRHYKDM